MSEWRVLASLLLFWSGFASLMAQSSTSISGIVLDASMASVPGAQISVVDEDSGFRRASLSTLDGSYVISPLEPGTYKITLRKAGFRTMIRFGVRVNAEPVHLDFHLVVGSVLETITVEGTAAMVDDQNYSVKTTVGRDEFDELPLNGRSLLSVLELSPGTIVTPATRGESGQFTVNGQRPNTHEFLVDGISANTGVSGGGSTAQATGGTLPGMTAFGSFDASIPIDSTQELSIQTSSSAVQFGRLPGAQVSLSSRSGSNELHGTVYYGFRNEALSSNDWFSNRHGDPKAPQRLQSLESSLGGPLRRNRTFFFVNYNRLRFTQPFAGSLAVPSLTARATAPAWIQPALDLFPQANAADLANGLSTWSGGTSQASELDAGSIRVDQAITSRLSAFARFSGSGSGATFGVGAVNLLGLRSQALTVGADMRVRPNLLLNLRLNESGASLDSLWQSDGGAGKCDLAPLVLRLFPNTDGCSVLVRLSIDGLGQAFSGPEGERRQSQYQVAQSSTWSWRSHTISFGGDYRRLAPRRDDAVPTISLIASSLTDFDNIWKASLDARHVGGTVREYSLFAADTWKITPRFSATFGLRWELSPAPIPGSGDSAKTTDSRTPFQSPIWQSSNTNFAPRAGIAYRLTKDGSTVLRAGGGLFFDSSLSLATDLINDGPLNVDQYQRSLSISAFTLEYGFIPNLRLPMVEQWNATVEHAFAGHDTLSASYVGSSSRDLIRREVGGPGTSDRIWLALATNHGRSSYQSFQAQYRHTLSGGIQATSSYAWAHSIDNGSADTGLNWVSGASPANLDRASSDFDVRHSFTAGVSYAGWRGWSLNGMLRARSGFPINVLTSEQYLGIPFANAFRPDLVGGQPVWKGGELNPGAFRSAADAVQGTLGRNAVGGFGMNQLDVSLRREFSIRERQSIELRVEAFNALNHPNFADPVHFLDSPLFGQSTSMLNYMLGSGSPGSGLAPLFQSGGARSLQLTLRLKF